MKLAYGALGWQEPIESVVRAVRNIGYGGIEVVGLPAMLKQEPELLHRFQGGGEFELVGSFFSSSLVEPDLFETEERNFHEACSAIVKMGGSTIVVSGGRILPQINHASPWRIFCDRLPHLKSIASEMGLRFSYHPHSGTLVHTVEELRMLANSLSDIEFTLDTGHLALTCSDPVASVPKIFREFGSRTNNVHLKDITESKQFTGVGDGILDFRSVIETLHEVGYSEWLTSELDASPEHEKTARRTFARLSQLLQLLE